MILKYINDIIQIYKKQGLNITNIHGDGEFNMEELRSSIRPIRLHISAPQEHVPEVEKSIKTIKERCRCATHAVPYKQYMKLMTISLIESMNDWLNLFPSKNGISKTMSISTIVKGRRKPVFNKKTVPFGAYFTIYTSTMNNMKSRGLPGIYLKDSNDKGEQYVMNILTEMKIH